MKLAIKGESDLIIERTFKILNRHLARRNCPKFELTTAQADLVWELDLNYPEEGFSIADLPDGSVQIKGGGSSAILYGVGKMLHTASFANGNFQFGLWRGFTSPQKSERVVYLATHFHNYYHVAPFEEISEYLEDLALWGYNRLMMWVDKHHFNGPDDPALTEFVERTRNLYSLGNAIGLKAILGTLTNEGYANTPKHLAATFPGRSFYYCEVCPSTPEGMELILKNHADTINWFKDLNVAGISLWPYDQGGCACHKCSPWGCNGMYTTGKKVAELFHSYFPKGKIIYSTWLFDYCGEKEWEGLAQRMADGEGGWIDAIMADSHNDFPHFPLEHGVPGNRPLLNFPEISMWGMHPWGGLGANPLPNRFRRLWGQVAQLSGGGIPYSEGIYEDFNKILYANFYWNGNNEIDETIKEYCNFEFGYADSKCFMEAIEILEKNHMTDYNYATTVNKYPDYAALGLKSIKSRPGLVGRKVYQADPKIARDICNTIDSQIPEWGQKSWRWRIIFLRALIDYRLKINDLEIDEETDQAFEELARIFHSAGISEYKVSPITKESCSANRSSAVV
ncbi:MAG: hypothetical protein WCI51_14865 [Lentisphaerota bacterium]